MGVANYNSTTVVSDIEYNEIVTEVVAPNEHCNHLAYCHDGTHWEANIKVAQANAQLIAAAPELLAALQTLMEGVANLPPITAIEGVLEKQYKQAEKAINKALGL